MAASFKVSMENLVTFLLTALCFFCQTSNCQDYSSCGLTLRPAPRGKILGGLESRPGMWPWQVAIFRRTSDEGQRPQFFCGGALINSRWVLSVAHCFHKGPREKYIDYRYTIKAGDHNIVSKDPHEQERNAFRIYNHPNFIPSTYENDIALVELDKGVKMGPKVRGICLPNANETLSSPGEVVSVAGWGFKTKGSHSSVLLYSAFEIQSNKNCKDKTTYLFNETVMFCAGHGEGGNDTCKGDSGGSTVREVLRDGRRRWVTVGLVSWGEGCGIKGKYGYYTKVEPFVNWIQKKVNGSILSCGDPGNIPNGRISGSDFLVGFTVKYKCNEGYRLRGRSRSRCKRNGKWTKAPTCQKVECRDPGRPRNGVRRPRRKKYHYKEKIRFRCKTNYTIIGRYAMMCRSDGTWSGFKPACLAPCKDPGIPEGGVRLDHSFKHSQTVRFMCRKSNQPPSVSYLSCSNGRWNQNIPRCIADCNDPGIPANGQRRGKDFTLKNKVFYTCDRGYMRVGPEYLQCQSNRRWSDKAPTCEPLSCTRLTAPKNAYIHSRRQLKEKYGFNEVVMFQCNKGYRASGSPFVRCLTNGWSKTNLRCLRVECKDPGAPRNGVRWPDKNKYVYEDRIDFRCNKNYALSGNVFIICQSDRTWTRTVPRCLDYTPCGFSPVNLRARIVGGNKASRGNWPWQVGIYKLDNTDNLVILCGGALIRPGWVLTAAHCFFSVDQLTEKRYKDVFLPLIYTIRAGDHHLLVKETTQQEVTAKAIFIHRNYMDVPIIENDIALVQLRKDVKLGPSVRTICLPRKNESLLEPGNFGIVAGWGATQVLKIGDHLPKNKASSKVLRHSAFTIQKNELCDNKTKYYFNPEVTFCAAGDGKGGNDTCKGDSGGSFVREVLRDGGYRWVSAGLYSWGEGCGIPDKYGYYTRVESFIDWIEKTIKDSE